MKRTTTKSHLLVLFSAFIVTIVGGCGGGGGGGGGSSPTNAPSVSGTSNVTLPAAMATGIQFLPQSFNSSNQFRTSLVHQGASLFFSDSSASPLKKLSLTDFSISSLARKIGTPEGIRVFGADIYWVDGGRLNRTSLDGTVTTLLASGARDPIAGATADIVIDNTDVYWVNTISSLSCSPSCTWIIQRVPLSGNAPSTLVTTNREIVSLKSDTNNIYWEERGIEPVTSGCMCGSSIKSVPKNGGAVVTLVDGLLNGLLPPPPMGQISGSWYPTGGIAVNGSAIYFGDSTFNSYRVIKVPSSGGAITVLASRSTSVPNAKITIQNISTDGTNVYWIDTGNSAIDKLPVNGGSITTLASGLQLPVGLAISAVTAFWTEQGAANGCCAQMGAGQIRQVPLTGGTFSAVINGLDAPNALAIDNNFIYWAEIWRVAKAQIGGGSTTTLASGISSDMARIAIDQSNIYILDGDLVKKVPIAGGTVEKLSSSHGGSIGDLSAVNQDIVTDGNNVYWTVASTGPIPPAVQAIPVTGGSAVTLSTDAALVNPQDCYWRIAVDSQNVYWSTGSSSFPIGCAVKKVPIGGGITRTVVDAEYLRDFTVDGTYIYFSILQNGGVIKRTDINGGSITNVASKVTPWVLANDNLNLYWIDPTQTLPSGIGQISKSGGAASFLVQKILESDPLLAADGLAVDQSGVYWTESVGGKIYSSIVQSTLTFPLLIAMKALAVSGESRQFTVSGDCSGTGSSVTAPGTTPSSFEGVAGFSAATTDTLSLTNCTPASSTDTSINYYDTNYIPLGFDDTASGGDYAVFLTPATIPTSVRVGNTGAIGTMALFTSRTKVTSNGSEVLSYIVEADTANTATINLVTKQYNAASMLMVTSQNRYRITTTGKLTRLSEDDQESNGSTLHLFLTFN